MKRYLILAISLFLSTGTILSQDNKSIELKGYVTTMQSVIFDSLSGPFQNENLLHNRLNFKGYINNNITFAAELRNRLFTGDMVRYGATYSGIIGADQGFVDMSWNILDKQSFLLNSAIDRLWLDFNYKRIQVTIGRQRINWGQTFVWNPNDIFNAYSFFDFDYVERPGSDAIRIQVFPSASSAAELAIKVDSDHDVTAAGLFRFNALGYDIQFLAGFVNSEDVVIGTGWSGAIGSISFRGEGSWFQPYEEFPNSLGDILLTAGFDKIFKNNSIAQIQFMYCNNPLELINLTGFYSGNLSAKNLAFSEFSAFGQFTWAVNPLLNLSLSGMWFPDLDGFFAGPS
ncbi:MAG TPA: hypothetical protein VMW32_11250, partial [Bacteroidales bacterium]|nr:hypothetical protein [Bacteroidales bacterium]